MNDQETTTRDRLIDAAVGLMQEKGPTGSGTSEILARAGATRGSFYFHFPDGKEQLVGEAVARNARATAATITEILDDHSARVAAGVRRFFGEVADDLEAGDFREGCAVGATVLDCVDASPPLRAAGESAFEEWSGLFAAALRREGLDPGRSASLGGSIVAAMEGALIVARARRDTAVLVEVGSVMADAVEASLGR
jgi:TetR/AcrR family transcriptional repressor of lmrAB and yxaGH operons